LCQGSCVILNVSINSKTTDPMTTLHAFEFLLKLNRVSTISAMTHLFRDTIAGFGFDTFACGEVDLQAKTHTVFYVIDWPRKWRAFYFHSNLIHRDPVVETLAYRRSPYTWTDLKRDRRFGKVGRDALKLAAANGWTEGLVVPAPSAGRRVGLLSMVGHRKGIASEEIAYLSLISLAYYFNVQSLVASQGFAAAPVGLTKREIETLRLVASGLTDAQIARQLRVATSTAHEFVEKAKRRLGVRNRASLIGVAVALRIVDPYP
jgi:DNA-binding CsgD family transcriptional regulator